MATRTVLPCIRMTKEQLDQSPSRQDGISRRQEALLRADSWDLIKQLGIQLRIPQTTISLASIYFIAYFSKFSYKRHNRYHVALACLYLSIKANDHRRHFDDLICTYYRITQTPRPSKTSLLWQHVKCSVISRESVLCDVLGYFFEAHYLLPHRYLNENLQLLFRLYAKVPFFVSFLIACLLKYEWVVCIGYRSPRFLLPDESVCLEIHVSVHVSTCLWSHLRVSRPVCGSAYSC